MFLYSTRDLPSDDSSFIKRAIQFHKSLLDLNGRDDFDTQFNEQDPEIYTQITLASLRAIICNSDNTPVLSPQFLKQENAFDQAKKLQTEFRGFSDQEKKILCKGLDIEKIGQLDELPRERRSVLQNFQRTTFTIAHGLVQGNQAFVDAIRKISENAP